MKITRYLVTALFSVALLAGCHSANKQATSTSSNAKESQTSATTKRVPSTSEPSAAQTTTSQVSKTVETKAIRQTTATTADSKVPLNDVQKNQINQAFLDWAGQRAVIGNMAVSDWFFDHGAAGRGDWYASTPDGHVQVQDNQVPGKSAFPIRAIGGCVFYTSKDGGVGKQELMADSFAANYAVKMDFSKPVSKYLLGDNGVVYELKTGNGASVSTNTGFGEYADDGSQGEYTPDLTFQRSEDLAAQKELQALIQSY